MWPLACRQPPAAGRDDQTAIKFKICRQLPEETIDESDDLKKLSKQPPATSPTKSDDDAAAGDESKHKSDPLPAAALPSLLPHPSDRDCWLDPISPHPCIYSFFMGPRMGGSRGGPQPTLRFSLKIIHL